jgi:isopenicillin N synthase-like dioxygenase
MSSASADPNSELSNAELSNADLSTPRNSAQRISVPHISLASTAAAAQLDAAATSIGFFQIADHAVPTAVINRMRAATEAFFALPNAEKQRWCSPSPDINRGYAAKGTEGLSYSLDVQSAPDLFEAFNLGPETIDETKHWAETLFFARNIWPDHEELAHEFRAAVLDYYAHVESLAHTLTDLFAEALQLSSEFFAAYTDHSTDTLRINHYQRSPNDSDPLPGQLGMGPHTDYGIVTVLYADQVPGLQILHNQQWVDVMPDPDCFLVNLGDLTAKWTNDRWRSTLHRVLPPEPGQRRRSVAFFHDGNYDALIECLPTCTTTNNPPKYPSVTAGEHLMEKLLGPRTMQPSRARLNTAGDRSST